MKKALFPSIALVLVLGLALMAPLLSFIFPAGPALAAEDDPYVCLESLGPGQSVQVSEYKSIWAGLFRMSIDGVPHDGWCIEPYVDIAPGWCFNATLLDKPRETPWCEIGYIMTSYSATTDSEAAAIQLAIWKFLYGRDAIVDLNLAGVETRALQIYDDAAGKCLTGGRWVVVIDPAEKRGGEEIQSTITLTGPSVGGDVQPISNVGVLAPWIGLTFLLVGGVTWFALRRRST